MFSWHCFESCVCRLLDQYKISLKVQSHFWSLRWLSQLGCDPWLSEKYMWKYKETQTEYIDVSEINGTFVAFVVSLCGLQKVGLRAFSSDASVALISDTSISTKAYEKLTYSTNKLSVWNRNIKPIQIDGLKDPRLRKDFVSWLKLVNRNTLIEWNKLIP